jgi:hypothetical protein
LVVDVAEDRDVDDWELTTAAAALCSPHVSTGVAAARAAVSRIAPPARITGAP